MKKIISIIVVVLITTYVFGQSYIPFATDSTQWSVGYSKNSPSFHQSIQYKVKGDTTLNGISYFKVYYSLDLNYNSPNESLQCFIREDTTKKVFVKYPESSGYDTSEILLYNFNLAIGDTVTLRLFNFITDSIFKLIVNGIDTSFTVGRNRKSYHLLYTFPDWACTHYLYSWTEGIGNQMGGGIFYNESPQNSCDNQNGNYMLQCFWQKGIYLMGDSNSGCDWHTNVNEIKINDNNYQILPNPVVDVSKITVREEYKSIEIYNMMGKVVKTFKTEGFSEITINRKDYKQGYYILKLINNNGFYKTSKFIIQ